MDKIFIPADVAVMYVTATSFPEGILQSHEKIQELISPGAGRKYYGISRPEHGQIVYRAAQEVMEPGEAEKLGLPTLLIKAGNYACLLVKNYTEDSFLIKNAFDHLLEQPGLDPEGYCVEWYLNDNDVMCMIRLVE